MSEVSFISPAALSPTRTVRAPENAAASEKKEAAPPPVLPQKTKVKTEQLSKFTFGYTFLDPETLRVVGQFPVEPAMDAYRK